jgi:hypothetical protein
VGLKSLKSLNLTNGYPNNKNKNKNKNKNNKVKSKPLELRSRVNIGLRLVEIEPTLDRSLPDVALLKSSNLDSFEGIH